MSCPDEETFARVQARSLSPAELADFHHHLDNCPACLELAAVLGCLYDVERARPGDSVGENNIRQPASGQADYAVRLGIMAHRLQSQESKIASCAMTLAHAYFCLSTTPMIGMPFGPAPLETSIVGKLGYFGHFVSLYVGLWCLAGLVWACVACWALLTRRRWARLALRSYAVLSIPTIVLAPLGVCVLFALRRPQNYRLNSSR